MAAKFSVEVDGKIYECEREVSGKIKLTQTITVIGIGWEEDEYVYGNKLPYKEIHLMQHFANMIARRIIGESKKG